MINPKYIQKYNQNVFMKNALIIFFCFFRTINPSQNIGVSIFALGEGWHNYHHVFPWDYKTAEWGNYSLNFTTGFIDFFAKIGWAYDLKSVSPDIIEKRVKRTGDGSHATWGWGDKDQQKDEIDSAVRLHRKHD